MSGEGDRWAEAAQLTLPLWARSAHRLEDYLCDPEDHLLDTLRHFVRNSADTALFLHGPVGSGKTHLLLGLAASLGFSEAVYLSLAQVRDYPPEPLCEGLQERRLVCLDDLQAVASRPAWEAALFHLFNACQASGARLVIASDGGPAHSGLQLPDLVSRLSWGLVLRLEELRDEQKKRVLLQRAAERGIALSAEVLHYLFSRSQRDMNTLMRLLDTLDRESLTEKRQVTIPFIKKIMQW